MIQSMYNWIPFFPVFVPAGFPSPAADYIEEEIDLNKFLKGNSASTYIIRVIGDSMIGAHITDNALLVVDRSAKPVHNSIVLASINGESTVKRLCIRDGIKSLIPANPKYKPIEITDDMEVKIEGVVTNIIINAKQV